MRFWLLLIVALATVSSRAAASAASVVLVHPADADAFVEEVFHRVRGEMRVQAIPFQQEEGGQSELSEAASRALLERNAASACVLISWRGDTTLLRIWVVEAPAKPPTLLEAVSLERNAEAPTLLAARAVDLLSMALRRAAPAPAPVARVTQAGPERPGLELQPPPERWLIDAGMSELGSPARSGPAFGPELSVLRKLSPELGCGVHIAGPLLGGSFSNSEASARAVQGLVLLKLEAAVLRVGPFTLFGDGGAGVHFVRVTGTVAEGIGSLAARRAQRFTPSLVLGAASAWALSPWLSLLFAAQANVLLPAPRIAVGRELIRLPEPDLELAAGLRFVL